MASNLDVDKVVEKIVSDGSQTIGDFGAQMLPVPKECQVVASCVISHAAYQILTDVFEVAAGTGFSFNAMSLTLKQIQKQIEELAKKVDKLLMADMKTAKDRIWHGMNYLQEEKEPFPWKAFNEFNEVLSLAEKAFHKVETFEDKLFCKQLAIFTRVMNSTYNPETKQFVPLIKLSAAQKRVIADSVFHDVETVIQQFEAIEIPWTKKLSGKGKKEKEKNQNILDSLLKCCLPVIWNFQDVFMGSNEDDINKFVPEGEEDAALVTLRTGVKVWIWKQINSSNKYSFQWYPCFGFQLSDPFKSMNSSQFPIFTGETCSSKSHRSIRYTCNDNTFFNLKDYLKYLNEDEERYKRMLQRNYKSNVIVTRSDYHEIKYLNVFVFDENTTVYFDGDWYSDFIQKMNSKEDLLKSLKEMPQILRFYGKEWIAGREDSKVQASQRGERRARKDVYIGKLIIEKLLEKRKEWCEREMIDLILNEKNILAVKLHLACQTDKLELVKRVVELGGFNEEKVWGGKLPSDFTNNQKIKQFLSDFKNGASISFD